MSNENNYPNFVDWFRQSSPYIHAHRGKVFVLSFGGELLNGEGFSNLIHDIALLNGLGIKLVIVAGARPQIEERLKLRNIDQQIVNGLRVTDDSALVCVKEANGAVRVEIEALLSMGLANSPMAGTRIRVASGNFVTAKPLGIIDGTDYQHTGEVRRVDAQAINEQLSNNAITLLPALGYSPTGEVFNLSAADVAGAVATALKADKLIFLCPNKISNDQDDIVNNLIPSAVNQLLSAGNVSSEDQARVLRNSAIACQQGVNRVHILDQSIDGVLLTELFTREGAGTLISAEAYESIRDASIDDVGGILELIEPLEQAGVLVKRSRELLEQEITQFSIIERDGTIIGCAALYTFASEHLGELACVAVHPDYRKGSRGDALLAHIETRARNAGLQSLFVLTTRSAHWFRERDFHSTDVDSLPKQKLDLYNWQRGSKVFAKKL